MIAARLHEYGKPLVVEDIPIPDIQADEILVKVSACGVCRTDAEPIDGYFQPYFNIPTPITLGLRSPASCRRSARTSSDCRVFGTEITLSSFLVGAMGADEIVVRSVRQAARKPRRR